MPPDDYDRHGGYGPGWWGASGHSGGHLLAALGFTAVWMLPLLVAFAMFALMRLRQAYRPRLRSAHARMAIEAPGPSALEVLREQYALGEIDLYTFADTVKLVLAAEGEGYSSSTQYA